MKPIKFAGLFFCLVSFSALAMLPPLTNKELEAESNIIVLGEVTSIDKTGEKEKNNAASKTGFVAALRVDKVIKGSPKNELKIKFWDYDYKPGYTGGADHVHHVGEKGKFYLSCNDAGECRLSHWNGYIAEGEENPFDR